MKNSKLLYGFIPFLIALSLVLALPGSSHFANAKNGVLGAINLKEFFNGELPPGTYFTVKDERSSKMVTKTARYVHIGDEVITKDNEHYKVTKISGTTAYAKFLGIDKTIAWDPDWDKMLAARESGEIPVQGNNQQNNKIAVYHTHSAESYVPTDGAESVPNKGGIFKVGKVFSKTLEKNGANAVLSLRPHEPHDANAYSRSRRTAMQLMKQQPIALIDVHRDGVPDPAFYTGEVKEAPQSATAIRLVVGRQNPHMQANLDFAKQIKAYMDKTNPGLIKEIFMAKGDYNQDLSPRAILIEAGTHTNKREQAQKGVALFAGALPGLLGIEEQKNEPNQTQPAPATPPGTGTNATADSPGSWNSLWILLGVAIVGGLGFLLISTGSVSGSKEKMSQFFTKEWTNALGVKEEKENKDDLGKNKDRTK